jgi:glycosyltransferase involved in cell wall biosynthesis
MARVTVLVTTYNSALHLPAALEGVTTQTFKDFDVVVADDGSTDETRDVIEANEDLAPRFVTGPHVGVARNTARAFPYCEGDLLAFTAGDDRWLPHHLEVGVAALDREPSAALSFARHEFIDGKGTRLAPPPTARESRPPSGRVNPYELMAWNYIGGQTVVLRRRAVDEVGGIDPSLLFVELDLFVRLVQRYPIVYNDLVTAQYRLHGGGMSNDLQAMLRARLELYEKHLGEHWTSRKRTMVSEAYTRTAYRQLWPQPDAASVAEARRNLVCGFRIRPRSALQPLHALMFVTSLFGGAYAAAVKRIYPSFAHWRLKLRLQRALGLAK